MENSIEKAFRQICADAAPAAEVFVSLYCDDRFYGGPEEGGWYGTDTRLVATQRAFSRGGAEKIKAQIDELAAKLTREAEDARNRHCAEQVEWLEARGLEDDYLAQPDGGERYWVCVEDTEGSFVSTGDRCYS